MRRCFQAEIWLDVDLGQRAPKSESALKVRFEASHSWVYRFLWSKSHLTSRSYASRHGFKLHESCREGFDLVLTWQDHHLATHPKRS